MSIVMNVPSLDLIDSAVTSALREDLGFLGDITSQSTLPSNQKVWATFRGRSSGVICGLPIVERVFAHVGSGSNTTKKIVMDGDSVDASTELATIEGDISVLSGERVALNFLCHLSGIATLTRQFVDAVSHTSARVCCTRKTLPGLRAFQKYAVRCGGGVNHRFGLSDAALIKDNHIALSGGIAAAINRARSYVGHMKTIEVEVENLSQLEEAVSASPDSIMLDNMSLTDMREAVNLVSGRVVLEASGNVSLDTIGSIAETGVDYISVGRLTMSAPSLDIGLDID